MKTVSWIDELPGGELLRRGLADFRSARRTVPACLVAIGRTRLTLAGFLPASLANPFPEPERQLYQLLRQEGGDAYSRYNSLLRELISFENAFEQRSSRSKRELS